MNKISIPLKQAAQFLERAHKPGYKIYPLVNPKFYSLHRHYKMFDGAEKSEIIKSEHNYFNFLIKESDGSCYYYVFKEAGKDFGQYKAIASYHNLSGGSEYRVVVINTDENTAIMLNLNSIHWDKYDYTYWSPLDTHVNTHVMKHLEYCTEYQGKELTATKNKPSTKNKTWKRKVRLWLERHDGQFNPNWNEQELEYAKMRLLR